MRGLADVREKHWPSHGPRKLTREELAQSWTNRGIVHTDNGLLTGPRTAHGLRRTKTD